MKTSKQTSRHSPTVFFFSLLLIAIATIGGCDNNSDINAILKVIVIDPDDDSCTPFDSEFQNCAQACETNPLGCANDILKHVAAYIGSSIILPVPRDIGHLSMPSTL